MLNMLPRLIQPKEVAIKKGSLIRLKYLTGRSALIVCGKESAKATGALEKAKTYLAGAKIETHVYDGLSGDPTTSGVKALAAVMTEKQPEWIVALGGGAVIDAAKLAWALYEHPASELSAFYKAHAIPALRAKAKLIAIPTTAGTGSEASTVAVVKDEATGRKVPIVSTELMPDLVILDCTLTTSLSPRATAFTAIDALTHAAESYCSSINNAMTDAYAVAAGRLIFEQLLTAVREPASLEAREKLQYAAYLAGVAQNITSVGATHALAHALGARAGLAHGHANAIFLAPVMKLNASQSPRPEAFARAIGCESLDKFVDWLRGVMDASQLETRWEAAAGASCDVKQLATLASEDVCARTNPKRLTVDDFAALLEGAR